MTEQIVIKLNKKKFKPLLDECIRASGGAISNYSECVGKTLFFMHIYLTEKNDKLDKKTIQQFLLEHSGTSKEEMTLIFFKKYNEFLMGTKGNN